MRDGFVTAMTWKSRNRIILILILVFAGSFLFTGCTKKTAGVSIIKGEVSAAELPSFIQLGEYKGIKITLPKAAKVSEKDITQQIEYTLNKAGETKLTSKNVKAVSGYDSIPAYKKAIKESLEKLNQSSQDNEAMNEAWDAALENAVLLKCPQNMLEKQQAQVKAAYENNANLLNITYEEVLKRFDMTEKDIKAKAVDYVKSDIMVYAIAKVEKITVSDEEYKEETEKRMKYFQVKTEEELSDKLGGDLHFIFLADKVMKLVYDKARLITE